MLLEKWRPFLIRDYKGLLFELVRTYDEAFTVKLVSDDSGEFNPSDWGVAAVLTWNVTQMN